MQGITPFVSFALLSALPAQAFQSLAQVQADKAGNAVTVRYTSPGPGRVSLYKNGQLVQGMAVVETGAKPCAAGAGLAVAAGDLVQVRRDRGDAAIAVKAIEITDRSDKYEAESAVMLGGAHAYAAPDASGGKAVRYIEKAGEGVRFSRASGGSVLRVRYAAPEAYCNMSLYVNGRFAKTLPFRITDGWDHFRVLDLPVSVPEGAVITIVRNPDDGEAAIDKIELLGAPAIPAPELASATPSPPVEMTAATGTRTTVSLDGIWLCQESTAADKETIPASWKHSIPVPGLSEMARPVLYGNDGSYDYLFMKREFILKGKVPETVRLKINKGWYGKKVWVNGVAVGEHRPNFTPAYFDIAAEVKGNGAVNTVIVRCGKRYTLPPGSSPGDDLGVRYDYQPGLYDDVSLILAGDATVENIRSAPNLENSTLRVIAAIRNRGPARNIPVTIEIREAKTGKLAGTARTAIELGRGTTGNAEISVKVADCMPWTPETPFLYELAVKTPEDVLSTKIGMRTFAFDPVTKKPMLNGRIYMLRGTSIPMYRFFEDPECAANGLAWNKEWARKIIRLFKGLNLNTLRFHVGFAPEIWYEVCDEEGYLVQDEYPIWGLSGRMAERLTADILQPEFSDWMLERNNHPCLAIWDAQNETAKARETEKLIRRMRSFDLQNRPWDGGSGKPQSPTDTLEQHPYYQLGKPLWTTEAFNGQVLADQDKPPPNPVDLNEYSWTWLNRDGSVQTGPAACDDEFYAKQDPRGTVDSRRRLRAEVLSQETEWHRTNRHAMVMYFVGLNFSRSLPENESRSDTSDDLLPGIYPEPEFNREFQQRMQDAFAPVGLMIHYFNKQETAGAKKSLSVYVMNDKPMPWSGEVVLRVEQDGKLIVDVSKTFLAVATGYRARQDYVLQFPAMPGHYQLVAQYVENGKTVKSIREVVLVAKHPCD
ncbi:MAG: glycoside hydrolase family 2 TIM barrel-domain containing protein [Planctomycetota bacterium]